MKMLSSFSRETVGPLVFILACSLGSLTLAFSLCSCRTAITASKGSAAGTYALATINGKAVPCQPPPEAGRPADAPGPPEVKGGTLTLNTDGTFTSTMDFGFQTAKFSGTYIEKDSRFRLKWAGAGETTGSFEGTTFTMTNEGVVFTYRK